MGFKKDLTGQKFGKLTVIRHCGFTESRNSIWRCNCECGGFRDVINTDLTRSRVKSCGCGRKKSEQKELSMEKRLHNKFRTSYRHMKERVEGRTNFDAQYYLGRIFISDKWNTFEGFKEEMWNSFIEHINEFGFKNTTLDRIDNNKDYSIENCRWATIQEQVENRRNQIEFIAHSPDGKTYRSKNQRKFAREHGLKSKNFITYIRSGKLYCGWRFEYAE